MKTNKSKSRAKLTRVGKAIKKAAPAKKGTKNGGAKVAVKEAAKSTVAPKATKKSPQKKEKKVQN
jgi:hypothetical protein